MLKCCTKCGITKPILEFHRDKHKRCGFRPRCKVCCGEDWRNYYNNLQAPKRRKTIARICTKCHTQKPIKEFVQRKDGSSGFVSQCKNCRNEKHRLAYKMNPKKIMAYSVAWRRRNPGRARLQRRARYQENPQSVRAIVARHYARKKSVRGTDYTTAKHIRQRWEMWGNRCYLCGDKAVATDHLKPLARGGAHLPCNLRPICKRCNSRKQDKWPIFYWIGDERHYIGEKHLTPKDSVVRLSCVDEKAITST